jgi:nucleoside phosphorylase
MLTRHRSLANPGPTIGILTSLPKEFAAVKFLINRSNLVTVPGPGAGRRYAVGTVSSANGKEHEVALALADVGNNVAPTRAALLLEHFPSVRSIVMMGIAGGTPCPAKPEEHAEL